MKIYLSLSLSEMNGDDRVFLRRVVAYLKEKGHIVLPEDILLKDHQFLKLQTEKELIENQKKIRSYKRIADVVVIEASKKSIGLGQEIAISLTYNKPVIILYRTEDDPHILVDQSRDNVVFAYYDKYNLEEELGFALSCIDTKTQIRYNLNLTPRLSDYLTWISNTLRVSRAQFIRTLLRDHMKQNSEYSQS